MKTYKSYITLALIALSLLFACEPNKELYQQLDDLKQPYNRDVEYKLTDADYNAIGGAVQTHKAFNDTALAMDYVPNILAQKYVALNLRSSALVTYNHLVVDTIRPWEKIVFGYTLTYEDYQAIGGSVATYQNFWSSNPAQDHLPDYLLILFPNASEGQQETIIYNFYNQQNLEVPYADTYEFDGQEWIYIDTITDMVEADYILTVTDYEAMGFSSPQFPSTNIADRYIPIWLKQKFPYAYPNDILLLQYVYGTGTSTNIATQYMLIDNEWVKQTGFDIEVRSEQYVYAASGWIFDPTIRFIMTKSDYATVAYNDPIPHPTYADNGYYYGASGYYGNFDMRLAGFHLRTNSEGEYFDPDLVEIHETQGAEAATEELFRRIVHEGLIVLLQIKFPDAQPQVGGVDVHYVVGFETYNDNLSRSYLEAEYKCAAVSSGDTPPQFEYVDGPRDRLQ